MLSPQQILILPFYLLYFLSLSIYNSIFPRQKKSIAGEVLLITGAGSGIGRLLALKFAALGGKLVLADLNQKGLEETKESILEINEETVVSTHVLDITSRDSVKKLGQDVRDEGLSVSILINNAGIVGGNKLLWDSSDGANIKTVEVNALSHFWTVKEFLPDMIDQKHGHVVTISSMAGIIPVTRMADYVASKYGATAFDEGLRHELTALGLEGIINTTAVYPIFVNTGMFHGAVGGQGILKYLFPILSVNRVCEEIVNAVLTNEETLYLPRSNKIAEWGNVMLSHPGKLRLGKLTGAFDSMNTFEGRND